MIIDYKEIGKFECIANKQAKRIIVRYRDNMFRVTYPYGMHLSDIQKALDRMAHKLIPLKEHSSASQLIFMPGKEFHTFSFTVKIVENTKSQFYITLKNKVLYIVCPQNSDYENPKLQMRIRNSIEQVLRAEAKRLFPEWIDKLAKLHNFTYNSLKINKSRTRWGSCSSLKNINLSYYCLLLPFHLIELIILHELCHTKEMNHSDKFWKLLNHVTDEKAKQLTLELKQSKTTF